MHRSHFSQLLFELHLSQLRLSQFSKISTTRISRYLGGTLDLKPEEALRLSQAIGACWSIQNGSNHVAESLPINWDESAEAVREKIAKDPEAVPVWNELQADVEFFESENISALTLAIPLSALAELMQSPAKFIKIRRNEILNLFRIKIENPETPSYDLTKIKELLALVPTQEK